MAILFFACVPMQTLHIAVILHQTCMPVMSHLYKSVSTALPVYIYTSYWHIRTVQVDVTREWTHCAGWLNYVQKLWP